MKMGVHGDDVGIFMAILLMYMSSEGFDNEPTITNLDGDDVPDVDADAGLRYGDIVSAGDGEKDGNAHGDDDVHGDMVGRGWRLC